MIRNYMALILLLLPTICSACRESEVSKISRMGDNAIESFHIIRVHIEENYARTGNMIIDIDGLNSKQFPNVVFTKQNHPILHSREFYKHFTWKGNVVNGQFVGEICGQAWETQYDAKMVFKGNGRCQYFGPKVSRKFPE
jgi:hypothetical protein